MRAVPRVSTSTAAGPYRASLARVDDILPALRKAGVTEDQIQQMLVENPRAIFAAQKKRNAAVG